MGNKTATKMILALTLRLEVDDIKKIDAPELQITGISLFLRTPAALLI